MCIAKFEQQCVVTIIKIIENEPKSRWLDEKILLHVSFILTHLTIAVPFLKAQAITTHLLRIFSKYFFATSVQSVYRGCYIY